MKHLFLSLETTTTLLLILLSITANAADDNKVVYDVMGQPLIPGQKYYISPYNYYPPIGGGFTWKKYYDYWEQCNRYHVVQYENNLNFGEPIAFYPSSLIQNEITFSTNLNIAFKTFHSRDDSSLCHATSKLWKVEGNMVQLGGHNDIRDHSSVFTIEDLKEGGYSIRFCPGSRRYACGGLGIVTQNGERQVVVNGTSPLAIRFEPEADFIKKYGSYA